MLELKWSLKHVLLYTVDGGGARSALQRDPARFFTNVQSTLKLQFRDLMIHNLGTVGVPFALSRIKGSE
jgi:hypothetical protein